MKPTFSKKRLVAAAIAIPILFILLLWLFYPFDIDRLPPKTPQKIARDITDLEIPNDTETIFYERNESFVGDYMNRIVIGLSPDQTEIIAAEWEEKGYGKKPMPKEGFIGQYSEQGDHGYYLYTDKEQYSSSIALNITGNKLIIIDASQ